MCRPLQTSLGWVKKGGLRMMNVFNLFLQFGCRLIERLSRKMVSPQTGNTRLSRGGVSQKAPFTQNNKTYLLVFRNV